MAKIRSLYIFLLFLFLPGMFALSQRKILAGVVKDAHSDEPIPFASLQFLNTTVGKLSDSSGKFEFNLSQWPSDTLEITCVGYQFYRLYVPASLDSLTVDIIMERGTFNEGAKVKTKVNKGLFLWRKIVENKSRNDKFQFQNFSYEVYNKLELDIKNFDFRKLSKLKPFKPVTDIINSSIDTTEGFPFLPTYLTEAISDYYYQPKPLRRREIIKAVNTNGVKNESMTQFLGNMDQNVSVYGNFIPVMNKQFVSPASDNGDAYYNYRVVDTQLVNQNRYYHLVFTPKRRGENTFEGDCWVHAGTYAIQKMNLRLGMDANVNYLETLSLIQEYRLLDDSTTWFLAKDKFVADFTPMGKQRIGFIGRKTTTYKNIIVNDSSVVNELSKNKLIEEVITLPGAAGKAKDYWIDARHEELSKNEKGIIKMIDTLTNAPEFKKFTNVLGFVGTGYLNVGNFQLGPWYNWMSSNLWEGFRVRFDLGTNYKFHKKIWWHTYLAYGFKDQKVKGKAELFFLPAKHPRTYFYGSYTNDLDFGQYYYGEVTSDNIFTLAIRKSGIPVKFMKIDEKRFEFFHETKAGFSTLIETVHKDFEPLKNIPPKDSFTVESGQPLNTFELSLRLRFAYLEKFLESHFFRTSLGSPYPIPEIRIIQGVPGIGKSAYRYTKVSGSIRDFIKLPPFGSIEFLIAAGKTFGTVPYTFLDIAPGNEIYYYNKYAFSLMNKYEFIHDKYAGITFEHNIGNGLFRFIPKLKFRQFYTIKTLWGSLTDANKALNFKQGYVFETLDGRTYLEVGTGIDNILKVLRIDFIWRLLPTPLPKESNRRFGVFGSFRLTF
ncbi:MAG TPA: DUF5686 family protein [Chitinophagaceae bacterium]|nr:DUF5686 family protein [Chitinophagaceae bacterium]